MKHAVTGAVIASLLLSMSPARAAPSGRSLFERLAGSWVGVGAGGVTGSQPERIRCRAEFSPRSASQLRLVLRCASESFSLEVESDITQDGDRLAGTWTETRVGVSGDVVGSVGPGRFVATVSGLGLSGDLAVTLRGDVQAISIASTALSARAALTLRRA